MSKHRARRTEAAFVAVLVWGAMLTGAAPANAEIIGTGEVKSATLNEDGTVTLVVSYSCPLEYDGRLRTVDEQDTWLRQRQGKELAAEQGGGIGVIECTGEQELATRTFSSESGTPFRPGRAVFGLNLFEYDGDEFGPGLLQIRDDNVIIKPSH